MLYIQTVLTVVFNDVGDTDIHMYTFFHYLVNYKRHIFVKWTSNYTDFLFTLWLYSVILGKAPD